MGVDLWGVAKRFVNFDSFHPHKSVKTITETDLDRMIKNDRPNDPDYRVLNLATNTFNESHFKDNGHTKPTFKFKLFHIFDERKNKYRISKLRVILAMEAAFLFAVSVYISLFVDSEFFSSEFAVNPVVAILLLICASIVIAGIFVIPTGIIGWILRRIYLYLTK